MGRSSVRREAGTAGAPRVSAVSVAIDDCIGAYRAAGALATALHGIRAMRVGTEGTRIELPQFRDAAGLARSVVTLPPEICQPIGDAVLEAPVERGIAKRRFAAA